MNKKSRRRSADHAPLHHSHAASPALVQLEEAGMPYQVHEYTHDSDTTNFADEACEALGVEPNQLCKTLMVTAGGKHYTAVIPAANQLNLKDFAKAVGAKKAALLDPHDAERVTGYVVGGISPMGQRQSHLTVICRSIQELPSMYLSAGRRGLSVQVNPDDIATLLAATWASISQPK